MLGKERLLYSGSFETNVSKTIFPFQTKPKSFKGEGMKEGKRAACRRSRCPGCYLPVNMTLNRLDISVAAILKCSLLGKFGPSLL